MARSLAVVGCWGAGIDLAPSAKSRLSSVAIRITAMVLQWVAGWAYIALVDLLVDGWSPGPPSSLPSSSPPPVEGPSPTATGRVVTI